MAQPEPLPANSRLSQVKREAILEAAEHAFLRGGFAGTNVDEIAASAQVSKPTVYRHFGSKEDLFVTLVNEMTTRAGDHIHSFPDVHTRADVAEALVTWSTRQLTAVLTPRLMQMRRLVIGEVARFPQLASALYDAGPGRAITALSELFHHAHSLGLIDAAEPDVAAEQFNWLVMGSPINRAMLLGDDALGSPNDHHEHARRSVDLFLDSTAP